MNDENRNDDAVNQTTIENAVQPEVVQSLHEEEFQSVVQGSHRRSIRIYIIVLCVGMGLVAAVITYFSNTFIFRFNSATKQLNLVTKENSVSPEKQTAINYSLNSTFAAYNLETTPYKPSLPEETFTLDEIYNLKNFENKRKIAFTDDQKNALISSGFFITPNTLKFWHDDLNTPVYETDDWTTLYGQIMGGSIFSRAPENSVFVSSDFLLHVYHRLIEKQFEYLENKTLYPILKDMTDELFNRAVNEYAKQNDPDNKQSYERIIAFFAVPKAILDASEQEVTANSVADQQLDSDAKILNVLQTTKDSIPQISYQKAEAELKLVLEAKSTESSPLFGELLSSNNLDSIQDYTQFTPRSHYRKNSILRSYFRAMMWYGRNNFVLSSNELTRDAIHISLLTKMSAQLQNWENIYVPTTFLVGKSDDLGVNEYVQELKDISTPITSSIVSQLQTVMKKYQNPQIQSGVFAGNAVFNTTKNELLQKTKGFRFMGQRFTPDAFIFSSLTQGDEKPDAETNQKLPSSTTALMVMSSLGDTTADSLITTWISNNAATSDKILPKKLNELKTTFSAMPTETWTQNIYWAWLYTLRSLQGNQFNKTGYPMFMKNDAWNKKSLYTQLGSWTELKHDTLLYAKQSYAEYGAGGDGEIPPVPKGYVEPNILFFDRLIALVKMTKDGFQNRGLLDETFKGREESFLEDLQFFKKIAIQEIQNEKISDDDFERLRTQVGPMAHLMSVLPGEEQMEKDSRAALVADVHTDAVNGEILYEGNAIPNNIFVAVKDVNGTRLTQGLVYDYYEFKQPLQQRLTDQDWWKQTYTEDRSQLPPSPEWIRTIIK